MCETYNGWSNRETWAVMLYLNNTIGLADEATDVVLAAEWWERSNVLERFCATFWTVDGYALEFGDDMSYPVQLARESQDIGSLYRVHWSECAESLLGALVS